MRITRSRLLRVGLFLLGVVLSLPAAAQTNEEVFQQFQWNFSTPGARANAMGRAFIGSADDASAAITNPAGLMALTRPQVYAEVKSTGLYIERLAAIDSLDTGATRLFGEAVSGLSFFDVALPIGSRFAVAFSRHEFLRHREIFKLAPRPIPNDPDNSAFYPVDADVDFRGVSWAGSIAAALTGQLRLGVTVSFDQLDGNSTSVRRDFDFGSTKYDLRETSIIVNQSTIDDSATATSVKAGLVFQPNEMFSAGLMWASGSRFDLSEDFQYNPGRNSGVNQTLVSFTGFPKTISINVPDRFGAGVAYRPLPRLLVVADALRIRYSDLSKNVTPIISHSVLTGDEFTVKDATEIHVGAEYAVLAGANPVFVRAGLFTNPDHRMRFTSSSDAGVNATNKALFNLGPKGTETGYTAGAGIAVGRQLQADVAFVYTESARELVVSAAVRF